MVFNCALKCLRSRLTAAVKSVLECDKWPMNIVCVRCRLLVVH